LGILRSQCPFKIVSHFKEFDRESLDSVSGLCIHLPGRSLPEILEVGSKPQEPFVQLTVIALQIFREGSAESGADTSCFPDPAR